MGDYYPSGMYPLPSLARIERERAEGGLQYPWGYCSCEGERAGTVGSQGKPAT